jgi:phosphate transport system substrate-binding protein
MKRPSVRRLSWRRRVRTRVVAPGACAGLVLLSALATPAGATVSHALISGSGSSWSSNAVNQWIADVQPNGLQVVYSATGSAQGRKDFAFKTTDYAVSDLGYLGKDPVTGEDDTSLGRAYAYLPIVAGGTSFPYQVRVGGKLVRNIRLSGQTLAKIFTNQIRNWNDKAITADNNGRQLPSIPIVPVVHSEGSGSSYQFTKYLDTQYPGTWRPFLGTSGGTEYFPRKGTAIAQNGSDGVMNFVASAAANGAIGYDEYSYALGKNWPVAKIENSSGYFTLPTQYNVAVALTQAIINQDKSSPNYLLQDLHNVYRFKDVRTYPLSSYSYMIIPTASSDSRMTTAKRQTLADFLYYSLCQGQAEMGPIGYSPLPINLVQASFAQTARLKAADSAVDLTQRNVTTCHNPTFVAGQPTRNYLAEVAPKPPSCDQTGAGPCDGKQGATNSNPGTSSGNGSGSSSGTGTGPSTGPSAGPSTAGTGTDPTAGGGDGSGTGTTAGGEDLIGTPVDLAATQSSQTTTALAWLAVLEILLLLIVPPVIALRLWRRRAETGSGAA